MIPHTMGLKKTHPVIRIANNAKAIHAAGVAERAGRCSRLSAKLGWEAMGFCGKKPNYAQGPCSL
jgi:hypothetical protein